MPKYQDFYYLKRMVRTVEWLPCPPPRAALPQLFGYFIFFVVPDSRGGKVVLHTNR